MFYSDDPVADFHRHDKWKQSLLDECPRCDICGEVITDKFYEIDCEAVCPDCLKANYERTVDC